MFLILEYLIVQRILVSIDQWFFDVRPNFYFEGVQYEVNKSTHLHCIF